MYRKRRKIYESARRKCPWGATGIVRRVEECVIIGQKSENRINTGFSGDFQRKIFDEKQHILTDT